MGIVTSSKVMIDPAAVAAFLRSSDGPVMRRFIVVGEAVKQETIRTLRDGFPTDFLAPSIVKRVTTAENGPHVTVGSDRVKTRPHEIVGNPTLAFQWKKVGGLVFFHRVQHPGSDFTEYLTAKLIAAAITVGRTV